MAHPYSADEFLSHAGKIFRAEAGGPELTLVEVERMPDGEARERAALPPGYIVLFRGPPEPVLQEGMHTLATDEGDRFTVYIMPIHTPQRDRQNYQVVFG